MKATMAQYKTLFCRHASNPILTGKVWPYSINTVFNAGATLLPDGSTLLLTGVTNNVHGSLCDEGRAVSKNA
jgi:hypothetical protein